MNDITSEKWDMSCRKIRFLKQIDKQGEREFVEKKRDMVEFLITDEGKDVSRVP